jgi:hypothetical protein
LHMDTCPKPHNEEHWNFYILITQRPWFSTLGQFGFSIASPTSPVSYIILQQTLHASHCNQGSIGIFLVTRSTMLWRRHMHEPTQRTRWSFAFTHPGNGLLRNESLTHKLGAEIVPWGQRGWL